MGTRPCLKGRGGLPLVKAWQFSPRCAFVKSCFLIHRQDGSALHGQFTDRGNKASVFLGMSDG